MNNSKQKRTQERQRKRAEKENQRSKKFTHLRRTGMMDNYYSMKDDSAKVKEKVNKKADTNDKKNKT